MVGQFVLGLAVSAPIFMFAGLQLRALQATDTAGDFRFAEYFGARLVSSTLALALTAAVSWAIGYRGEVLAVVLLVGVSKFLESISDICYGLLQQGERLDRVSWSMFLHGFLTLVALAAGVLLTGNLAWGMISTIAARLALMVLYDFPAGAWMLRAVEPAEASGPRRRTGWLAVLRPSVDPGRLLKLTTLGAPLAVSTLLVSLNTSIPRYFVAHYESLSALGIFGAITALMTAGGTISRALNQASSPRLARYFSQGHAAAFWSLFVKTLLMYAALGLGGVALAAVAGRPLLTLLFQPEYAEHSDVLLLVMIALAVAYLAGGVTSAMVCVRCIYPQLPLLLLTTAASLLACYLLVPTGGLRGAATALAISKVPTVIAGVVLLRRRLRDCPNAVPAAASGTAAFAPERSSQRAGHAGFAQSQPGL
jgi:O-antigen/teichoic acid export membrane protein